MTFSEMSSVDMHFVGNFQDIIKMVLILKTMISSMQDFTMIAV